MKKERNREDNLENEKKSGIEEREIERRGKWSMRGRKRRKKIKLDLEIRGKDKCKKNK